jgi:hypothetical protein
MDPIEARATPGATFIPDTRVPDFAQGASGRHGRVQSRVASVHMERSRGGVGKADEAVRGVNRQNDEHSGNVAQPTPASSTGAAGDAQEQLKSIRQAMSLDWIEGQEDATAGTEDIQGAEAQKSYEPRPAQGCCNCSAPHHGAAHRPRTLPDSTDEGARRERRRRQMARPLASTAREYQAMQGSLPTLLTVQKSRQTDRARAPVLPHKHAHSGARRYSG